MSGTVKGKTGARTTARGAQARSTRRRIVDSAAVLFVERGYGATTLEQIAERAGVAVQTVYFHFGNKRTVLKEAVDVAVVGDDEPVAVLQRSWVEEVRAEPDAGRAVVLWVRGGRGIFARVAPLMSVVRDAAVVDPDMAAQWETNAQQRAVAFAAFAQQVADRGALRPGLSVTEATDMIFALHSFEVFLMLTVARGWSVDRWETWMAEILSAALVAPVSERSTAAGPAAPRT